ncbi:MAG: hypothetical protein WC866_02290 [Patescibacteria group bacterium]|jgi:hypothetical protein
MGRIRSRRKVIIKQSWKCNACGAALGGEKMACTNCGDGKEASEAYVPPADIQRAPEVTDPEELRQATAGPNWTCEFCNGQERNLNGTCRRCGGVKPDAQEAVASVPLPRLGHRLTDRTKLVIAIVAGALLLALAIVLIARALRPEKAHTTVQSMTWQRTVILEQRTVHPSKGWEDAAPNGAYDFSCKSRKKGEKNCNPYQCNPHTVEYDCDPYDCRCRTTRENCHDLGNGYQECEDVERCDTCYKTCQKTEYDTCYEKCDVREQWCTYRYDTWSEARRSPSGGEGLNASWPTDLTAHGPNERLKYDEHYSVVFVRTTEKGLRHLTYQTKDYSAYARFSPGEPWELEIHRNGRVEPKRLLRAEKE